VKEKRHVTRLQSHPRYPLPVPTNEKGESLQAARWALHAALEKKGLEPVLLDVSELCSYTEYLLLVSGRSDRQVEAIAEAVGIELKKRGRTALGVEGISSGQWALLDYGDVVVHVFYHPVREHYDLEGLWIDATRVEIEVPGEARVDVQDLY
jgi:ribosome-associated protein